MPIPDRQETRCLLLAPSGSEIEDIRRAIRHAARDTGVLLITAEEVIPEGAIESVFTAVVRADLIVAVIEDPDPDIFYEVGLAHATGKPVIFLVNEGARIPTNYPRLIQTIFYNHSEENLIRLKTKLRNYFLEYKNDPRRFQPIHKLPARPTLLPIIDFDRIEPREFENLCFELLTQMGFRRVEWGKALKEVDVVATLPKKDPDGYEYHELWFISLGLHFPPELLMDMAITDPDFFMSKLLRIGVLDKVQPSFRSDSVFTFLVILFRNQLPTEMLEQVMRRAEHRARERRMNSVRLRVWDRQKLVSLIQQYPQIAFKYFSEEGRSQSKYRKTPEELYHENVELNERLQVTFGALQRAERDAVWKDVAFTAAHKLGNPIFALETNLQGLKRKIENQSAMEVVADMDVSIEKAKTIISQFKSLTRAQEISKRPIDIVPIIQSASHVAADNGVHFELKTETKHPLILADPLRISECFDELFANTLHWLNKEDKRISIEIDIPKKKDFPPNLDDTKKYIRILFADNGCGIPAERKQQIFAPFYTTYPHGTGLGLALVQRIIEGHGGIIREIGKPEEGAVFELYLPQATKKDGVN